MQQIPVDYDKEQDSLILNISGVIYCIIEETVLLIPDGLLKVLWNCYKNPDQKLPEGVLRTKMSNRFFLQRSPHLFDIILQCYVTGKIHVPEWVCYKTVLDEIQFWNLGPQYACSCCCEENFDDDDIYEETTDDKPATPKTRWQNIKRSMWKFFQQPNSSRGATVRNLTLELLPS